MKKMKRAKKMVCLCLILGMVLSIPFTASAASYRRSNQDCTAYSYTGDSTFTGETPRVGMVAVHPTTKGGTTPVIPFGTFLYVDSFTNSKWGTSDGVVPSPEGELSILKRYQHNLSKYWLDFYWDTYNTADFGKSKITYNYTL